MRTRTLNSLLLGGAFGWLCVDVFRRPVGAWLPALAVWCATLFVAVLVHELGHAAAGMMRGMRLLWIMVGPLKLAQVDGSWRLLRARTQQGTLGLTLCFPRGGRLSARDQAWSIAGGPAAGLFFAALAFALAQQGDLVGGDSMLRLLFFSSGVWSTAFSVTSLIPEGNASVSRNDGQRLLELWRNTADARATLAITRWIGLLAEGTRPADAPRELLDQALAAESHGLRTLAQLTQAEALYDGGQRETALALATQLIDDWEQLDPATRPFVAGLAAWTHALVARDARAARKWFGHYEGAHIERHRHALVEAAVLLAESDAPGAREALARSAELRAEATWPLTPDDLSLHEEITRAATQAAHSADPSWAPRER